MPEVRRSRFDYLTWLLLLVFATSWEVLAEPLIPTPLCRDESLSIVLPAQGNYRFEYDPAPRAKQTMFSLNLWFGTGDCNKSHATTYDTVNSLRGEQKGFQGDFWAAGVDISDIPILPSVKSVPTQSVGIKWLTGGIDLLLLEGDYTVMATQGNNQQKSEIDFTTIAIAGTLKISLLSNGIRPYIGIGVGPAWTRLIDTRITTLGANPPIRERDRVWDTSNLFKVSAGCNIYLGKRFYFTIEYRWFILTNQHLLFPDETTNHHTAKVKTHFKDRLNTFGLGIRF